MNDCDSKEVMIIKGFSYFLPVLFTLLTISPTPLSAMTEGGSLPDTSSGYLVSVIVGVGLIIGGIILLRLQKNL